MSVKGTWQTHRQYRTVIPEHVRQDVVSTYGGGFLPIRCQGRSLAIQTRREKPTEMMRHMQGLSSMCRIRNWLLSFNLFISISSPKLICFNSRAIDEMT